MADSTNRYAVRIVARNYLVPWPSPVWWRFWEKVPRRKGFQVTMEVAAASAGAASQQAEGEVRAELDRKSQNPPGDAYRLEVVEVSLAPAPVEDAGFKRWFDEGEAKSDQ